MFGGDEFVGEVLEGQWVKGWDANISVFTAKLDGAGALNLNGVAAVAGTGGYGWMNGQSPFVMMNEAELTIEMEVPVDDTGGTASRDIYYYFDLVGTKVASRPNAESNLLQIYTHVNESGLMMYINKSVATSWTTLFDGSTYDDASARATGTGKFTIWRLVFHESHSGTAYRHLHAYLKQADTLVDVEGATENELTTSPYDISALTFTVGYPAFAVYTQNTTYFNASNDAVSQYVKVEYPDFTWLYDCPEANLNKGEVKLYDTMGSGTESDWMRVRDIDHEFVGDCVIQNGLIRAYITEIIQNGFYLYGYSAGWVKQTTEFRFSVGTNCEYPHLHSVTQITPEQATLRVKFSNTATIDDDYYVLVDLTLKRGNYVFELNHISSYPLVNTTFLFSNGKVHSYSVTDNYVGDTDLGIDANDVVLSDNLLVQEVYSGLDFLVGLSANLKPTYWQLAGYFIQHVYLFLTDIPNSRLYISLVPFALSANLFKEAELATISGSARLYMDGEGEDTVTEGQNDWTATLNCVIDDDDVAAVSVGAKNVKISSSAAGNLEAWAVPDAPLGKITKFDFIKFYISGSGVANIQLTLRDADGDAVYLNVPFDGVPTQKTLALPHSATDLQGWTQWLTFDFSTFTRLEIYWNATGAGEIVYIDGLHFYIGTTTARGRGETLSGSSALVADEQWVYSSHDKDPINDYYPVGRYLAIWRAKDTDQVADDFNVQVYNVDDSKNKNENNDGTEDNTLTASFAYYSRVFDIDSGDSGDNLFIKAQKYEATENTIFIDYLLIVPICNGQSFPQDLAHNALRSMSRERTVIER